MRWAKWILPAILAINGAVMMLAPAWWYPRVPGVIETGPLNDHFVRDIGAAYLACALAMGWALKDPARGLGVAVASATFLTPARGHPPDHPVLRDEPAVAAAGATSPACSCRRSSACWWCGRAFGARRWTA
jgi:hypothetical protein